MRSGSSLLVHLLNSHDEIVGYGETQNIYSGIEDFGAATIKILRHLRKLPDDKAYVMDKVLHRGLVAGKEVLTHPAVKIIFLIREPEMALSSMMKNKVTKSADEAVRHYFTQLEWINSIFREIPLDRWSYLTYSELLNNTSTVFNRIENLLNLSTPLTENYSTTKYTGVRGIGDSSSHIENGKIKRNISREMHSSISPFIKPSNELYKECKQNLMENNIY